MQSAIGTIQLKKINKWRDRRTENAEILIDILKDINFIRIPKQPQDIKHAWYKFYFYLDNEALSIEWNRERILEEINQKKFPCYTGGCGEIYLENCIKNLGFSPSKRLKNARVLSETSIMLCVHPTITSKEIINYANVVKSTLLKACK